MDTQEANNYYNEAKNSVEFRREAAKVARFLVGRQCTILQVHALDYIKAKIPHSWREIANILITLEHPGYGVHREEIKKFEKMFRFLVDSHVIMELDGMIALRYRGFFDDPLLAWFRGEV